MFLVRKRRFSISGVLAGCVLSDKGEATVRTSVNCEAGRTRVPLWRIACLLLAGILASAAGWSTNATFTLVKTAPTSNYVKFASPTLADLDGDGHLEILATSFDYTCYAFRSDGSLAWSLDYDPTNNNEPGFVSGDTIWTTPAAPTQLAQGAPLVLGAYVENTGGTA